MGKKPTKYSSNDNTYKAAALVAAAGIVGCGASAPISHNVVPGARPSGNGSSGIRLPTPFGESLANDGYWQVMPDFPKPNTFYFTNGNDLTIVTESPTMSMGMLQNARNAAGKGVRDGALYAKKYGLGGDTSPSGDVSVGIEYHTNIVGGRNVSVFAKGSIPLAELPEARHKDFLEQANLETRVGAAEARAEGATASVGADSTPHREEPRLSSTPVLAALLVIAAAAGIYAWYSHGKDKKKQQNK